MKRRKNKEHSELVKKYQRIKEQIIIYLRYIKIYKESLSNAVFEPWRGYDSFEEQLEPLQSLLKSDRFLVNTYSKEARELKILIKNEQRRYSNC